MESVISTKKITISTIRFFGYTLFIYGQNVKKNKKDVYEKVFFEFFN
jgi:hypothetical protein